MQKAGRVRSRKEPTKVDTLFPARDNKVEFMETQYVTAGHNKSETGQALAEYLLAMVPLLLAALGIVYLFQEAWSALFRRLLVLLGPWP